MIAKCDVLPIRTPSTPHMIAKCDVLPIRTPSIPHMIAKCDVFPIRTPSSPHMIAKCDVLVSVYEEFKGLLSKQSPIESYTEWIDDIVEKNVLKVRLSNTCRNVLVYPGIPLTFGNTDTYKSYVTFNSPYLKPHYEP